MLLAVALLLLLAQAWTSLSGGPRRLPESHTPGQKAQTAAEIACGLLSLVGVVTTFWRRVLGPWVLAGWVLGVTIAQGLAAVVWGRASVGGGLRTAGATLLAALGVVWLLRVGARGLSGG